MDTFRLLGPIALIAVFLAATGLRLGSAEPVRSGVQGTVLIGPDDRTAAADVQVTAGGKSVRTNARGRFQIPLRPGFYTVIAYSDGAYARAGLRVRPHHFSRVELPLVCANCEEAG